jgi:hypothetical protein
MVAASSLLTLSRSCPNRGNALLEVEVICGRRHGFRILPLYQYGGTIPNLGRSSRYSLQLEVLFYDDRGHLQQFKVSSLGVLATAKIYAVDVLLNDVNFSAHTRMNRLLRSQRARSSNDQRAEIIGAL